MTSEKDFLWPHLKDLPYFRALLRAVEARFYQEIDLPSPTLDLGCGDGHFTSLTFTDPLDVGLDPWVGPVREASKRGCYRLTVQGSGDQLPFASATFASAVSNSVLEHIPDVDAVLVEVGRVIQPGGKFVFCVPNQNFLSNLSISNFFDRIGLTGLGNAYRAFFNRISRHHHCDAPDVWMERLDKAGFEVERLWHYFSPGAFHVLEWGHYFGLPSLVLHAFTRRWIAVPTRWNLALTERLTRSYYNEPDEQTQGSYTFYITRRKADKSGLPESNP